MKRVRIGDIVPPILHKDIMHAGLFDTYCHVVLYEPYGHKALLIGFRREQMEAVLGAMGEENFEARSGFILIKNLLIELGWKVDAIQLKGIDDFGRMKMNVLLRSGKERKEIVALPEDALALAMELPCPIYVSNEMMKLFSFDLPKEYASSSFKEKGASVLIGNLRSRYTRHQELLDELARNAEEKSSHSNQRSVDLLVKYLYSTV